MTWHTSVFLGSILPFRTDALFARSIRCGVMDVLFGSFCDEHFFGRKRTFWEEHSLWGRGAFCTKHACWAEHIFGDRRTFWYERAFWDDRSAHFGARAPFVTSKYQHVFWILFPRARSFWYEPTELINSESFLASILGRGPRRVTGGKWRKTKANKIEPVTGTRSKQSAPRWNWSCLSWEIFRKRWTSHKIEV